MTVTQAGASRQLEQAPPATTGRDLTPLLIVTMWLYATIPALLQVTLGVRPKTDVGEEVQLLPLAAQSQQLLKYAIFAVAGLAAFQTLGRRRLAVPRTILLYVAPGLAVTLSAAVSTPEALGPSVLLYVFVGIVVAAHHDRAALGKLLGRITGVTALLSLAMGVAGLGLYSGGDAKGGLFGDSLLAGPTFHPNTLGMLLALGIPWIALVPPGRRRRLYLVAAVLALTWAASRTSWVALAVAFAMFATWRAIPRDRVMHAFGPAGLLLGYMAIIPAGIYMVATAELSQFSGRPYIWRGSLDLVEARPWLGWGPSAFLDAAERGFLGFDRFASLAAHAHSLLLQQLVTAGLLGLLALLVLMTRILVTSWRAGRNDAAAPLMMWPLVYLMTGWLEVPAGFYDTAVLSWLVWPALAICTVGTFPGDSEESHRTKSVARPGDLRRPARRQ